MNGLGRTIAMGLAGLMLLTAPVAAGAWSLSDIAGKTLHLGDFHGRWVLVNFWATWCPPCRQEIPDLMRLQRDEAGKLTVIGVAVSYDSPKSVTDFVRRHGMNYPIVLGSAGMAAGFGGIRGLPTSFLYGPGGELVRRFDGPQTEFSIERAMAPAAH